MGLTEGGNCIPTPKRGDSTSHRKLCILAEPATSMSVISGVTQLWKTNMAGKVTIPDPSDAINETFVLLPGNYH